MSPPEKIFVRPGDEHMGWEMAETYYDDVEYTRSDKVEEILELARKECEFKKSVTGDYGHLKELADALKEFGYA